MDEVLEGQSIFPVINCFYPILATVATDNYDQLIFYNTISNILLTNYFATDIAGVFYLIEHCDILFLNINMEFLQ